MELPDFSVLEGFFYSLYILLFLATVPALALFVSLRGHHAIRVRLPWFSFTAALSLFAIMNCTPVMLLLARSLSLSQFERALCSLSQIGNSLLEALCFFPVLFRFFYVHRMSTVVQAFSLDSDEQLAKTRQRRTLHALTALLIAATLLALIYAVVVSVLEPQHCFCTNSLTWVSLLGYLTFGLASYLSLACYVFFLCKMWGYRSRLKY